jgi:predicted RNA-binding Zn ribbon-like protein
MRAARRSNVPDDIALLFEFANSLDERSYVRDGVAHTGGDELATMADLERWMRRRGLLGERARVDAKTFAAALELREALRALLRQSPADRGKEPATTARINAAAAAAPLMVQLSTKGQIRLQPAGGASGLGVILAELLHASETGKLDRLKMCDDDDCRRLFYDRSKPSTRRWCASAVCGNRQKTRAYRQRLRAL